MLKQPYPRKGDKQVEGMRTRTHLQRVGRSEPPDVLQAANQVLLRRSNLLAKLPIFVVRRRDSATGWDQLSVFGVMLESVNTPETIGRGARVPILGPHGLLATTAAALYIPGRISPQTG